MTLCSLSQAAAHLGIDVKTLHFWLADASLSLHPYPQDARKKGITHDELMLLAREHHRHLALHEPAPPSLCLPPDVLALPEQVAALQAQVTALQQQLTELLALLHPPSPSPEPLPALLPATKPSSARRRPAAPKKTPAKPTHVIPRVEYATEGRYVIMCPKQGLLPFEPDTSEWFAWVKEQESFRFVGKEGHFTAHHWWRVPNGAWRAHRHIRSQNHVLRLAPNHELTIAILEHAAQQLQARLS